MSPSIPSHGASQAPKPHYGFKPIAEKRTESPVESSRTGEGLKGAGEGWTRKDGAAPTPNFHYAFKPIAEKRTESPAESSRKREGLKGAGGGWTRKDAFSKEKCAELEKEFPAPESPKATGGDKAQKNKIRKGSLADFLSKEKLESEIPEKSVKTARESSQAEGSGMATGEPSQRKLTREEKGKGIATKASPKKKGSEPNPEKLMAAAINAGRPLNSATSSKKKAPAFDAINATWKTQTSDADLKENHGHRDSLNPTSTFQLTPEEARLRRIQQEHKLSWFYRDGENIPNSTGVKLPRSASPKKGGQGEGSPKKTETSSENLSVKSKEGSPVKSKKGSSSQSGTSGSKNSFNKIMAQFNIKKVLEKVEFRGEMEKRYFAPLPDPKFEDTVAKSQFIKDNLTGTPREEKNYWQELPGPETNMPSPDRRAYLKSKPPFLMSYNELVRTHKQLRVKNDQLKAEKKELRAANNQETGRMREENAQVSAQAGNQKNTVLKVGGGVVGGLAIGAAITLGIEEGMG